jgi:hypothetical protein
MVVVEAVLTLTLLMAMTAALVAAAVHSRLPV